MVAYTYSAVLNTVLATLNSKTTIGVETTQEVSETNSKPAPTISGTGFLLPGFHFKVRFTYEVHPHIAACDCFGLLGSIRIARRATHRFAQGTSGGQGALQAGFYLRFRFDMRTLLPGPGKGAGGGSCVREVGAQVCDSLFRYPEWTRAACGAAEGETQSNLRPRAAA